MIPKNIYRAWQTQTFHKKVEKRIKKTIQINKEYSHTIFTEPQRDDFVHANFDGSIIEAYQQLNNVVAKVDLWRYLIIYKHGGVYLDMDASIEKPIRTFITDADEAVISAETNEDLFLQWALFYTKEHPIIEKTIEYTVRNIKEKRYLNDIANLTGPGVYTEALKFLHKLNQKSELNWNDVSRETNDSYKINENTYRIFGIDFNGNLNFKIPESRYLYQDLEHWKVQQSKHSVIKDD
jgi:inositol phosphorylceramide mannosyltransferase catalytic subunit